MRHLLTGEEEMEKREFEKQRGVHAAHTDKGGLFSDGTEAHGMFSNIPDNIVRYRKYH